MEHIFNNPYAKPLVKNTCSNPLQIWTLNTNVDIQQHFFNVREFDANPENLRDIQRKAAEVETFRQQLKAQQSQEAELLQQQDLIQQRDSELGQQYTEFQSKMDKIPFLKTEQRKALEDQFMIDLMKENDILNNTTAPLDQFGNKINDNLNLLIDKMLLTQQQQQQQTTPSKTRGPSIPGKKMPPSQQSIIPLLSPTPELLDEAVGADDASTHGPKSVATRGSKSTNPRRSPPQTRAKKVSKAKLKVVEK